MLLLTFQTDVLLRFKGKKLQTGHSKDIYLINELRMVQMWWN